MQALQSFAECSELWNRYYWQACHNGNGIISDSSEEGRSIAPKKRKRHEDENVVSKLQKKSQDFIE